MVIALLFLLIVLAVIGHKANNKFVKISIRTFIGLLILLFVLVLVIDSEAAILGMR